MGLSIRGSCQSKSKKSALWTNKLGVHFRRQQVIQGFIVDFYCHRAGLVIEVDGDVHDLQKEEDERREKVLSALVKIVRFRNDDVMRSPLAVVGKITDAVGIFHNEVIHDE